MITTSDRHHVEMEALEHASASTPHLGSPPDRLRDGRYSSGGGFPVTDSDKNTNESKCDHLSEALCGWLVNVLAHTKVL